MTSTYEEFRPMLQDLYAPGKAMLRAIKRMPTLRLLKKETNWRGRDYVRPLWDETPQAVGHDFTEAQNQKGEGSYADWKFTHKKIYGFASMDRLGLENSKGDAKTFLSLYTADVDGTMKTLAKELATKVFRGEACVRSTVDLAGSTVASGILKLANREDMIHFYYGMDIAFSDAGSAAGAAPNDPTGGVRLTVNSLDRKAGTLTVTNGKGGTAIDLQASGDLTTDLATGDFIHRRGDITSASNTLSLAGFESFILSNADRAAPGTFKNVDRARDVDRRAGMNLQSNGMTMEDLLIEALVRADEQNVEFTHFIMHPKRFGQLVREVDSKVVREDDTTSAQIGRRAVKVLLDGGEATIFSDPFCQVDKVWGINRDDLIMKSTGDMIRHIDNDVLMLREPTADAYEVRMGGYGELTWSYPGTHMHIEIT